MLRTRVGVLRGGPSSEYEVSINTGKTVLDNLPEEHYEPIDIFIDKKGEWHRSGMAAYPYIALKDIDVAFNALHGEYGEDGKVQQILEHFNMPYTGSTPLASSIGMNKALAKKYLSRLGLKTPYFKLVEMSPDLNNQLVEIFRTFPQPSIVKPMNSGSSLGVSVVRTFPELQAGVAKAFSYSPKVMIEDYIIGCEGTLGVIENFRGKNLYPLLPIEIKGKDDNGYFDYETKYSQNDGAICPGNFSRKEIEEIEDSVLKTHSALGLRHYSRTDFIVHPRRGVYILEVNTLPGLTANSLLPKSLEALGIKISEFLHHVVSLARGKR